MLSEIIMLRGTGFSPQDADLDISDMGKRENIVANRLFPGIITSTLGDNEDECSYSSAFSRWQ